jgi:hypothetical protein
MGTQESNCGRVPHRELVVAFEGSKEGTARRTQREGRKGSIRRKESDW